MSASNSLIRCIKNREQFGSSRADLKDVFFRDRMAIGKNLPHLDLFGHFGCVNALQFSREGSLMASGGDDRRILLWNTNKCLDESPKPTSIMDGEHESNIRCIAFDQTESKIFSGGNDGNIFIHDLQSAKTLNIFGHLRAVCSLSSNPVDSHLLASASLDGRVLLFDLRMPPTAEPLMLVDYSSPVYSVHSVSFNPQEPRLLATASSNKGINLWDVRKPKQMVFDYGNIHGKAINAMSVEFNDTGTQLIALRQGKTPVLFNIDSPEVVAEFDHAYYFNDCTMKVCCFAGPKDEYLVSGSDDFKIYIWKLPSENEANQLIDKPSLVLTGHRSIVNQVRFNKSFNLVASSGVEKIIKLWSFLPLPNEETPHKRDRKPPSADDFFPPDFTVQSTEVNTRLLEYFDRLVERSRVALTSSDNENDDSDEDSDSDEDGREMIRSYPPDNISSSEDSSSEQSEEGGSRLNISEVIKRKKKLQSQHLRSLKPKLYDPDFVRDSIIRAKSVLCLSATSDEDSDPGVESQLLPRQSLTPSGSKEKPPDNPDVDNQQSEIVPIQTEVCSRNDDEIVRTLSKSSQNQESCNVVNIDANETVNSSVDSSNQFKNKGRGKNRNYRTKKSDY